MSRPGQANGLPEDLNDNKIINLVVTSARNAPGCR